MVFGPGPSLKKADKQEELKRTREQEIESGEPDFHEQEPYERGFDPFLQLR